MLLKLLALPVTGPLRAIEQVANDALKELYDPAKIMAEFESLRARRASGDIDEETYRSRADALNERFLKARELASR